MSFDEIQTLKNFSGAQRLRQGHYSPDCLLVSNHTQYWAGTFDFILLWFFNCCTCRQQECLRLLHRCVNLVSIAVLAENGALKDFNQNCLNLSELCLHLHIVEGCFVVLSNH